MTQLAFADRTLSQAPNGNALALFLDGADGIMKVKDIRGAIAPLSDYVSGGGGGGSAVWGDITGTLSNQTDLQEALDEKSDLVTEDVTCNISTGLGGISNNQTIPAGTDLTTFLQSLLVVVNNATLSIVISPSTALQQIQTLGVTTTNVVVTPTYTAGTDDPPTNYDVDLTINGITTTPYNDTTPTTATISVSKIAVSYVTIQGIVTNPQRVVSSNIRAFSFIFPYYSGRLTPTSGTTPPTPSEIASFIQNGSVAGFTGQLFNSATLGNVNTNVSLSFSSSATAGFLFVALPQTTINTATNTPISTPAKTSWFVTANPALTEAIGGGGGLLFPTSASTQSITRTGIWTGNFDIYISGYQSASDPLTFQN
jgi:hypothetical protein